MSPPPPCEWTPRSFLNGRFEAAVGLRNRKWQHAGGADPLPPLAIDGVIGIVPVAGDVFDVLWRANRRNVRILREHLERDGR